MVQVQCEPTLRDGVGMRWRARYVDRGHEHTNAFARKADAKAWLDNQTADRAADELAAIYFVATAY